MPKAGFKHKNWEDLVVLEQELLKRRRITRTGCWLFTDHANAIYPMMRVSGVKVAVHRIAARIWNGVWNTDRKLSVMHNCDTPRCFNPAHLTLGTQKQNVRDAQVRGRRVRAGMAMQCSHGHTFTPENTYWMAGRYQKCRMCHKLTERRRRQRQREVHGRDMGVL